MAKELDLTVVIKKLSLYAMIDCDSVMECSVIMHYHPKANSFDPLQDQFFTVLGRSIVKTF